MKCWYFLNNEFPVWNFGTDSDSRDSLAILTTNKVAAPISLNLPDPNKDLEVPERFVN